MNSREYSIITLIKDNDFIEIDYLARFHSVSVRTIKNDLKSINGLLKDNHLSELIYDGSGKITKGEDFSQLQNFIIIKDFYTYKLSKDERIKLSSIAFALSTEYITFAQIADKMMVSRATIIKDLDDIKRYLKQWNLKLLSYPNKGILVKGKEISKRSLLFETELINKFQLFKILGLDVSNKKIAQRILEEQERVFGNYLTDDSYEKLVLYLCIMIDRNLSGKYIEEQKDFDTFYFDMAESIEKMLVQYCGVNENSNEVLYISQLLNQCRFIRKQTLDSTILKARFLTRKFIESISKDLEIDLTHDFELYDGLSQHLALMLVSNLQDYSKNDFLEKFRRENQRVIDITNKNKGMIEEYYNRNISENEVIFMSLHICAAIERKNVSHLELNAIVVCNGGVGTSQLLIAKLSNYFNFSTIKAISLHELEHIDLNKADIIVSTITIDKIDHDYVKVNPLLKDEDFLKVSSVMREISKKKNVLESSSQSIKDSEINEVMEIISPIIEQECPEKQLEILQKISFRLNKKYKQKSENNTVDGPRLYQLLTEDFVKVDVECETWEEAVRKSGIILEEKNYVTERYIDEVVKTLKINGPYVVFSKGFAFPHETFDKGSSQLGMSLIRLKKPVCFNSENDPVDFVCMISTINQKSHLKSFFTFVNLLQNKEFKKDLYAAKTPEKVAETIRKFDILLEC
ncbi:BglG family transcription antiterminator [Enterococcus faecium]|uniref:BglG family transcription antiterminator n=1 Tax=Enterococcus faecium TaxID=1352 RepID=UPI0011065132|nr:BglG family transcription antiterminator [Enterococcus faecium]